MAQTIQVAGPTMVVLDGSDFGLSDNDNLPTISFNDAMHEVKTVSSGAAPEEIVLQNTTATITVTVVKWDEALLNTILEKQRGAAVQGETVVGRRLVGGTPSTPVGMFSVEIASIGQTQKYEFTHCFIRPDGISDSQWGNRERTLSLTLTAIPNPADNVLYTYTA